MSMSYSTMSAGGRLAVALFLVPTLVLSSCRRAGPLAPEGPGDDPSQYPVESRFNTGTEGWTVVGDADLHHAPAGGNPGSSGYIFAIDRVEGDVFYFSASPRFLGNVSGAFGRLLTFDLIWSETTESGTMEADDVILQGAGMVLIGTLPHTPGPTWTSYAFHLDERGGWVHRGTDRGATAEEVHDVLRSLQSLRIRGEFRLGPEQGGLDNVRLGAQS
jgi:hypothetical protein